VLAGYSAALLLGADCAPPGAPRRRDRPRGRAGPPGDPGTARDRATVRGSNQRRLPADQHPLVRPGTLARRLPTVEAVVAVDALARAGRFDPAALLDRRDREPGARGCRVGQVHRLLVQRAPRALRPHRDRQDGSSSVTPAATAPISTRSVGGGWQDRHMLFAELVATSATVGGTRSRKAKVEALAGLLRALAPAEVEPAVAWLAGEPRQGRLGAGWRTLAALKVPAAELPGAHARRRRRGAGGARHEQRGGFGAAPHRAVDRAARRGHRGRAAVPVPAVHRGASTGRPGGRAHRSRGGGVRRTGRAGAPGADAVRVAAGHRAGPRCWMARRR